MADRDEPGRQQGPHLDRREGLTDANGPRADRTRLEGGNGLGVEARIDSRSQPCRQAVDAVAPIERPQHDGSRGGQTRADRLMQTNRRVVESDRRNGLVADGLAAGDDLGVALRMPACLCSEAQFTSPLALRKAAATVRGSFLSTSTCRLSSCIVGLSRAAPIFSRMATILALVAISGRTTGARK